MKGNAKKVLIYVRYALPAFLHIVTFVMFFIPVYRFGVGDCMSLTDFISLYWDKTRDVLFGTGGDYTGSDETFATIMFAAIIIFAILFIVSFVISVWTAIVAFRVFLCNDEDSAERWRRFFVVFVPNRIIAFILSSLGITITLLPYFITPLSTLTGSDTVNMVLEGPDAFTIGLVLLLLLLILSVCSSYVEKYVGVDVFQKLDNGEEDDEDPFDDD